MPGQLLIIRCNDLPELNSTQQTAYQARKELGYDQKIMRISQYARTMTVEVELPRESEDIIWRMSKGLS